MKFCKTSFVFIALATIAYTAHGQRIPLGETLLLNTSQVKKGMDPEKYASFMINEYVPAWNNDSEGAGMYFLQADRGNRTGEYLAVCVASGKSARKKLGKGSPFNDKTTNTLKVKLSDMPSTFMEDPDAYTEYQLIGGDRLTPLPDIELLGIHYIKVKPELAKDFEQFVVEKLHPTVGNLTHDMNLLYYKAIAGTDKGSFITIYAIESVAARERFWPTGGQEQDIVKELFGKYGDVAKELVNYLVEDSYLKPESGGGAAIFESLEWTDFVVK